LKNEKDDSENKIGRRDLITSEYFPQSSTFSSPEWNETAK